MDRVNLIPRIKERIEQLDTALFSAPATSWRYPACIIRNIKMDSSGTTLSFRMKNISLETDPEKRQPAFLLCYNKKCNFYLTVEGQTTIEADGLPRAPQGWENPANLKRPIPYRHTLRPNLPAAN